jgi:integrase
MNPARTDLQKQQRAQRAKLAKLQQEIADGRPPTLPDGKDEVFEWHPTIPDFAARIYRSGRGVWRLGYRTKAGQKRTETIGNMAVLPLVFAEKKARTILSEVQMHGRDPQAERRKLRLRPQRTVGQLCDEYFDEMAGNPQMSFRTIKGYRSVAKWYLDILRGMHFAELTPQDVATRVREISNQRSRDELDDHQTGLGGGDGGPWCAQQFRAMLSAVYKWALGVYPDEIKVNPVTGTWQPPRMKSTGQSFTMEELGTIWRACETLDSLAVPMSRNGYAVKPGEHVSGRDDELMSCREAARVTGLHQDVFRNATKDGKLRYQVGRIETEKLGLRPAHLVSVGDVNRFLDTRPQRSQRGDYSKVVRLLMLLGTRYAEIGGLRWSEVQCDCAECHKRRRKFPFRFLHIPTVMPDGTRVPEGMDLRRLKSRGGKPKDLVLYLPQAALDIIDSVPRRPGCDLLFGPADGSGAPSNGTLKAALNAAIVENEGAPLRPDEHDVPKWKHHWLRHSFETHLKDDLECPSWIVAAMVNHVAKDLSQSEGVYTHADYLQQQKRFLDIWANEIHKAADRIEDDQTNVHHLPRAETT